ncbi:MAG: hypothetical protein VX704_00450, partial [Verrucomicrobiota bacterium]|nr:hypothetical protein [Verrucomicrobiota bacterium]
AILAFPAITELRQEKDAEIALLQKENETLKSKLETLLSEVELLKARLTNASTQEERLSRLEQLVEAIEPGE